MKALLPLIAGCCLYFTASSTILTVSNNPSYPAQYSTISAAITAASPGDTIYIYPSGDIYSENINTSKKLVLIGSGVNPDRPGRLSTRVGGIWTISGSSASGFMLMGLDMQGSYISLGDPNTFVNNVVISDCRLNNAELYCNNILFENNIVPSGANASSMNFRGTSQRIIQNNIFEHNIGISAGDVIIRNNIFASNDADRKSFQGINGTATNAVQIHNNIFYKNSPEGIASNGLGGTYNFLANAEYKNNISYLALDPFPLNSNSSDNIVANPLFVNYPVAGGAFSFNYDYTLQPASPAKNYGTDGRDIGMWGGIRPVNKGFEPPIPRIYELTVSNSNVPGGGTIQLTIKATKAQ